MKNSGNQKRHRAHNARTVHAPSHQTVMSSSLGKPPRESASGEAANRRSCGAAYLPRTQSRLQEQANSYPLASNRSLCDLLIATLLWAFAILCALASIAILIHYANTLFGVE